MTHLEASRDFADALERVSLSKERIVLQRQGQDVAILVPIEDLPLFERQEDAANAKNITVWLEETDRLRNDLAAKYGILPDSALDIAADRAR